MSKTVYYNGDIVTVNRENQVAGGLLVEDGKIAAVGSREEILPQLLTGEKQGLCPIHQGM